MFYTDKMDEMIPKMKIMDKPVMYKRHKKPTKEEEASKYMRKM